MFTRLLTVLFSSQRARLLRLCVNFRHFISTTTLLRIWYFVLKKKKIPFRHQQSKNFSFAEILTLAFWETFIQIHKICFVRDYMPERENRNRQELCLSHLPIFSNIIIILVVLFVFLRYHICSGVFIFVCCIRIPFVFEFRIQKSAKKRYKKEGTTGRSRYACTGCAFLLFPFFERFFVFWICTDLASSPVF